MFPTSDDPNKLPQVSSDGFAYLQKQLAFQQHLQSLITVLQQPQHTSQPVAASEATAVRSQQQSTAPTPSIASQHTTASGASARFSNVPTTSNYPPAAAYHSLINTLGLQQSQESRNNSTSTQQHQQQAAPNALMGIAQSMENQPFSELSRRRPSLMSNFVAGGLSSSGASNDRYPLMYPNATAVNAAAAAIAAVNGSAASPLTAAFAASMASFDADKSRTSLISSHYNRSHLDGTPHQHQQPPQRQNLLQPQQTSKPPATASISVEDVVDPEDESAKREIAERLAKIRHEQAQLTSNIWSVKHKADMYRKFISTHKDNANSDGTNDDSDGGEDGGDFDDVDTLIDKIYADNRKIAAASELSIANLTVKDIDETSKIVQLRLNETYERGVRFMPTLIKAMRWKRESEEQKRAAARDDYETQLNAWKKKIARAERNPKKVARDSRHRDIFEKVFPEVKKLREEKERNSRVERSRSATLNAGDGGEVVCEKENEAKARAVAIIPPLYADKTLRPYIINHNGVVKDPIADTRNRVETFLNSWTDTEKEVFEKKIVTYGKNFAAIGAFLQSKVGLQTVRDCVLYYYLTKKRVNYKLKFGRKRKKIGRVYRPPVMPQLGDIFAEEGYSAQNAGRDGVFVECLLCSARMSIFIASSVHNQSGGCSAGYYYDDGATFVGGLTGDSSQQDLQNQIPICAKCINSVNKNKTANRCPLGTCGCGKRKTKPARSVPEKFHSLSVENKRFIVFRLKIPPSASKCCNACCKRILKEIESLMDGQLKEEKEEFNQRVATFDARQKQEQLLKRQELGFPVASVDSELLLENKFIASLTEMALSTIQKSAAVAAANEVLSAARKMEQVPPPSNNTDSSTGNLQASEPIHVDNSTVTVKKESDSIELATTAAATVNTSFEVSTLLAPADSSEAGKEASRKRIYDPSFKEEKTNVEDVQRVNHKEYINSKKSRLEFEQKSPHVEYTEREICRKETSSANDSVQSAAARNNSTPGTPSRTNFGSITQGTPMMRPLNVDKEMNTDTGSPSNLGQHPSGILQQYHQQLMRAGGIDSKNIKNTSPTLSQLQLQNLMLQYQRQQNSPQLPISAAQLTSGSSPEDGSKIAYSLLAHFGVDVQSKDAADELSRKLQQNPKILSMLQEIEPFKQTRPPPQQPSQPLSHTQRPSILQPQSQQQRQLSMQLGQQPLDLPISALFGQPNPAVTTTNVAGTTSANCRVDPAQQMGLKSTSNTMTLQLDQLGLGALVPKLSATNGGCSGATRSLSEMELMSLMLQNPGTITNPMALAQLAAASSSLTKLQQQQQQQPPPPPQQFQQPQASISDSSMLANNTIMLAALKAMAEQQTQQQRQQQQQSAATTSSPATVETKLFEQQTNCQRQQQNLQMQQQSSSLALQFDEMAKTSPKRLPRSRMVENAESGQIPPLNNQQQQRLRRSKPPAKTMAPPTSGLLMEYCRDVAVLDDPSPSDKIKRKSGLATAILPSRSPGVNPNTGGGGADAQVSIQQQYLPSKPQRFDERGSPAVTGMAPPPVGSSLQSDSGTIPSPLGNDRLGARMSIPSPHNNQRQTPNRTTSSDSSILASGIPMSVSLASSVTATTSTGTAAPSFITSCSDASSVLPSTSTSTTATVAEELMLVRSASVKAESNCGGGVSSSCYESLSEDEGEESNVPAATTSTKSPSDKMLRNFSDKTKSTDFDGTNKTADESDDTKTEMFYYNVLTLSAGSPKSDDISLSVSAKSSSVAGMGVANNTPVTLLQQQQSLVGGEEERKPNEQPALQTTCIYEPLSDDDD